MEEVGKFIQFRGIRTEDVHLIEELSAFPKEMRIMELHNLFNMSKDRSSMDLENLIQNTHDESRKTMYGVALEFHRKYDWMTSLNLIRVLEKI